MPVGASNGPKLDARPDRIALRAQDDQSRQAHDRLTFWGDARRSCENQDQTVSIVLWGRV